MIAKLNTDIQACQGDVFMKSHDVILITKQLVIFYMKQPRQNYCTC